jgi:hypothetical protein
MRGTEAARNGGPPLAYESGADRPVPAARPRQRPARERARHAGAPGADLSPPFPAEALALVIIPTTPHAFTLRHIAPSALDPFAPGLARRWREPQASALETVEKVVTAPEATRSHQMSDSG